MKLKGRFKDTLNSFEKIEFKNDFKVFLIPKNYMETTYLLLYYRVGSSYENTGESGLAHLLEHLMFKRTKRFPKNYIMSLLAPYGGIANASTSWETTTYYEYFPYKLLYKVLEYESDRMHNLDFTEEDFETERSIVLDERDSLVMSNPLSFFWEFIYLKLFLHHPYRNPVIGFKQELLNLTPSKVYEFYKRFYHPSNAFLMLGGKIPEQTNSWIEELFDTDTKIPRKELPSCEEELEDIKGFTLWEIEHPQFDNLLFTIGIVLPEFTSSYTPALDILSEILGGSKSSYLYKRFVLKKRKLISISTSFYTFSKCSVMFITGIPAQKQKVMRIIEELIRILQDPPTSLLSLKNIVIAKEKLYNDFIYDNENIFEFMTSIGETEIMSKAEDYFEYPNRLEQVEREDIEETILKFFKKQKMVCGILKKGRK